MIPALSACPANKAAFGKVIIKRPHPATDHKILNECLIERDDNPDKISVLQYRAKEMEDGKGNKYDYCYIHRTLQRPLPAPDKEKGEIMNDYHDKVATGVQVLAIAKNEDNKDSVLLCFEKRPTLEGMFDVIVNLPSGSIGDKKNNDTIEKAAKGEVKEEAGYRLGSNSKPVVLNPMLVKDHSANSDIISFVKIEGVEEIPNAKIGDVDEKGIFVRKPMLVPLDEIGDQIEEWTKNGIEINGERKSCIVADQICAALYLYDRDKEKNSKKA